MKIKSYAKINLTLDVLKKEKGYHKILTIFQQISLHDTLIFKKISSKNKTKNLGITLTCGNPEVPLNEENTVIKAANLLLKNISAAKQEKLSLFHITLQKKIPLRSGLGGGSSNAAATLLTLNKLWHLNLSQKKLSRLAAQIGKDVPFFLHGGTALGKNYGEQIMPLPALPKIPIIICTQNSKTSTKNQYEKLNLKKCGQQKYLTLKLTAELKKFTKKTTPAAAYHVLKTTIHNDFETIQQSKSLKSRKKSLGTTILAGSGPSLITLYPTITARNKAYQQNPTLRQIKSATLSANYQ